MVRCFWQFAVFFGAWISGSALAETARYNFQTPVTPIAQQQYDLHTAMMWVILVIFFLVFGVMFWAIFAHRRARGAKPASFHESIKIEIIWTVVPLLILLVIGWPATKTVVEMKDTSEADMVIKVVGYQWRWSYEYLNGAAKGLKFFSTLSTPRAQIEGSEAKGAHYLLEVDRPLVVPVGKKVRLLLTAADVIHSWWVPALGVKQDAIPGFVRDTWFLVEKPGVYRGNCAELCGRDHAFMPIVVRALPWDEYLAWVEGEKFQQVQSPVADLSLEAQIERGQRVYEAQCAACHQADGSGLAGAFPALKGAEIVSGPVSKHIGVVLKGQGGMPSFASLSDQDLAAVVAYERNAWGGDEGKMVSIEEVAGLR